jgi:transcriptional regulator with XRE-family HTH domain
MAVSRRKEGRVLLREWRERLGYSFSKVARPLGVSHVTVRDWELGNRHPLPIYRDQIEVLTSGEVPAASWPLSAREKRALAGLRPSQVALAAAEALAEADD